MVKKGIDQFVKKPIKNKIAKDWVKKQRILKKQGIKESVVMNELSLKKLEDAIRDFQKKIKKQGRVTNARDEEHLESLIANFLSQEDPNGDYKCDKCKSKGTCVKRLIL